MLSVTIQDPIFGAVVVIDRIIFDLINSQAFQRLRRIKQLSAASYVFPGCEHTRFSHSVGVYALAFKIVSNPNHAHAFLPRERVLFLVAALLHDIGHGPYSHTFERISGVDHEEMTQKIILEDREVRMILDSYDTRFATDITNILARRSPYKVMESLLSSQLDIDRMDYLLRDATFAGIAYGKIDIDRLLKSLKIIDGGVYYDITGVLAIEHYLSCRYFMYQALYYHPTIQAIEMLLTTIIKRYQTLYPKDTGNQPLLHALKNKRDTDLFLQLDDYVINGHIQAFMQHRDKDLSLFARDFLHRKIWKHQKHKPEGNAAFLTKNTVTLRGYLLENEIMIIDKKGDKKPLSSVSSLVSAWLLKENRKQTYFFYRL